EDRYIQTAIDRECQTVSEAEPGTQDPTLNTAAFKLGTLLNERGLEAYADEVVERLVGAGLRMINSRPGEPWTDDALREKVWHGVNDGLKMGRVRFQQTASPDGADLGPETALEYGIAKANGKRDSHQWTPEEVDELLARMNREHAIVPIGGSVR